MSGYYLINNDFTNGTAYAFTPNGDNALSSGEWTVPPQPIAANQGTFLAFQVRNAAGGMGVTGKAGYDVLSGGTPAGTLTLYFSDPYSGENGATAATDVPGLVVSAGLAPGGATATCSWTAAAPA